MAQGGLELADRESLHTLGADAIFTSKRIERIILRVRKVTFYCQLWEGYK